jgi:cobyrinic acid a,c-diamide synthase
VADRVDLDGLLGLARSARPLAVEPWSPGAAASVEPWSPGAPVSVEPWSHGAPGGSRPDRPVVALAGTARGWYGYAESAELLAAAGAEVVAVDPLRDEVLPPGTAALVVGAGLPEAYVEQLAANRPLREAVAELARAGRPVLAEGAGLLWLAREWDGRPMCGVLDATGATRDSVVLGYREATAATESLVAPRGAVRVGYKQHRAVLTPRAGKHPAWSWSGGTPEGSVWSGGYASQLALHWAGTPEIATRLVAAAAAARRTPVPAGSGPATLPVAIVGGPDRRPGVPA